MSRTPLALCSLGVVMLATVGCGEGSGTDARDTAPLRPAGTIEVLTNALRHGPDATTQQPARSGDAISVGELLTTDAAGLGQLDYPDGSLTRIGPNTSYTVTALTATATTRVITGAHDVGDSWHRVKAATTGENRYEVTTPVGTAAVRGTTFAVRCPNDMRCTVAVTEGTVEFRPLRGAPFLIEAGSSRLVTAGGPEGAATAAADDPWVQQNTTRDAAAPPADDRRRAWTGTFRFDRPESDQTFGLEVSISVSGPAAPDAVSGAPYPPGGLWSSGTITWHAHDHRTRTLPDGCTTKTDMEHRYTQPVLLSPGYEDQLHDRPWRLLWHPVDMNDPGSIIRYTTTISCPGRTPETRQETAALGPMSEPMPGSGAGVTIPGGPGDSLTLKGSVSDDPAFLGAGYSWDLRRESST